jgi:hypothetical protein
MQVPAAVEQALDESASSSSPRAARVLHRLNSSGRYSDKQIDDGSPREGGQALEDFNNWSYEFAFHIGLVELAARLW